jgi:hypothetical protein
VVDYTKDQLIDDLRDALRCGMTEALRHHEALGDVNISGSALLFADLSHKNATRSKMDDARHG